VVAVVLSGRTTANLDVGMNADRFPFQLHADGRAGDQCEGSVTSSSFNTGCFHAAASSATPRIADDAAP